MNNRAILAYGLVLVLLPIICGAIGIRTSRRDATERSPRCSQLLACIASLALGLWASLAGMLIALMGFRDWFAIAVIASLSLLALICSLGLLYATRLSLQGVNARERGGLIGWLLLRNSGLILMSIGALAYTVTFGFQL